MTLQKKMIQKIDEIGGIEKLTFDLERLRLISSEKKWFDNIIFYLNGLYTQVVDVESHAIEWHQESVSTIEFLKEFNKTRKDATVEFMIGLINFKLDTVAGVRKIS